MADAYDETTNGKKVPENKTFQRRGVVCDGDMRGAFMMNVAVDETGV